jgi:hypothetical protein
MAGATSRAEAVRHPITKRMKCRPIVIGLVGRTLWWILRFSKASTTRNTPISQKRSNETLSVLAMSQGSRNRRRPLMQALFDGKRLRMLRPVVVSELIVDILLEQA